MELSTHEIMNIKGGGINWGIGAIIGGLITLLVGVIDGYLRPDGCKKKYGR